MSASISEVSFVSAQSFETSSDIDLHSIIEAIQHCEEDLETETPTLEPSSSSPPLAELVAVNGRSDRSDLSPVRTPSPRRRENVMKFSGRAPDKLQSDRAAFDSTDKPAKGASHFEEVAAEVVARISRKLESAKCKEAFWIPYDPTVTFLSKQRCPGCSKSRM